MALPLAAANGATKVALKSKINKNTPTNIGAVADGMHIHGMFRLYGIICTPCIPAFSPPLALYFDCRILSFFHKNKNYIFSAHTFNRWPLNVRIKKKSNIFSMSLISLLSNFSLDEEGLFT
jgi:hypothetical protein